MKTLRSQKWIGYIFVFMIIARLAAYPTLAQAGDRNIFDYAQLALSALMGPGDSEETEETKEVSIQNGLFVQASGLPDENTSSKTSKSTTANKANLAIASKKVVTVTAYSSTPDQTDDSPFITANGTYVRDGIVACNFLPFGTQIRFPDAFGDKVFTVTDRMNKRHNDKIDIWMTSRDAAIKFGVKKLAVEVLK